MGIKNKNSVCVWSPFMRCLVPARQPQDTEYNYIEFMYFSILRTIILNNRQNILTSSCFVSLIIKTVNLDLNILLA